MSDCNGQETPEAPGNPWSRFLERIPLVIRICFYAAFFLAILLGALPWLAYRLDVHWPILHVKLGWLRVLGGVILAGSLATYLYSSYLLTSRGRGAYVEFDPPKEFVATGPYRWVRNPVAATAVMMLLGEAILLSSTGIFLLFCVAGVFAHLQVICVEEPLLRERFGSSYEAYLRRVPRWIPRHPREET